MDDTLVFSSSFDHFLHNLITTLERCKMTDLVINWEKCYFLVKEEIVLSHRVSKKGLEVDRQKFSNLNSSPINECKRG